MPCPLYFGITSIQTENGNNQTLWLSLSRNGWVIC